jgi:succinate-semialdehyde dehydrogenase / glutarate-semialdehyde dehydrogenase
MPFTVVDPTSGSLLDTHESLTPAAAREAAARGDAASAAWRTVPVEERARVMRAAGAVLLAREQEWARLMTREMGKPLSQALGEIRKCASVCDYYADHGAELLAPVHAETEAHRSYWSHEPLGVVLAVMPWNFPFWQVFRFAVPTLLAGNAALLKHAPNVPGCALAAETILREAGLPAGLFQSLFLEVDDVGALIADPLVRAVTLTGSVGAGRAVAAQAGAALKKTVLELGGSDPYVVLADADLEAAAATCVTARLFNSGQTCIAAKRLIVVEPLHDAFVDEVVRLMSQAVVGDPLHPATTVGPLARLDLRDALHDQVTRSIEAGARCVLAGAVPDGPGAWYPPTVLTGVGPGMAAYEEELFGPVACILRARDEEDAVRIANDTAFGLGAAVFTRDRERGERIARERLEAGACFVNDFVRSHPALPFGGVKESGYGRELSPLGILEFVNTKTVWVA